LDQARVELANQTPDVVLVDLNLPDGSGLSLFDSIGLSDSPPAVVLITGQASLDSAVEALRRGVSDYLTKPLDVERLRKILQDISQTKRLPDELRELRSEQQRTGRFVGIVGRSDPIVRACELITRIAPSSASVLITGESGSGKDVVARAIHELSRRRHGPWVPVNCGAITPSLMESELFGHERGSFTGAERRHKGYFEQASRGTLFLDEITEMPIELQVKLLRVLETNSLVRVGAETPIQVDVRILAASNRNVQQAIDEGKLRADLYYRLKVFQIDLAPLRERRDDVKLLAQAFLEDLIRTEGRTKRFSDRAFDMLAQYNWPGNVRELRNVVHFAYVLSEELIDDGLAEHADRRAALDVGLVEHPALHDGPGFDFEVVRRHPADRGAPVLVPVNQLDARVDHGRCMRNQRNLARRQTHSVIGHRTCQRVAILDDVEPVHRVFRRTNATS